MNYESAINIAIGCVLASAMDRETKQQVAERLRELEKRLNVLKDTTDLGPTYDEMIRYLVGKLPEKFLADFFLDIKDEKRAERLPLLKELYKMSPSGLASWSREWLRYMALCRLLIKQDLGDPT